MRGCGETGKIKQKGLRPRMWGSGLALGENRFPSYSEVVQKDTEKKRMINRNGEVERTEAEGVQRMGFMSSSLRLCSIIY